jgi:tetratricopeptide (TPR) repeat protein
MSDSPPPTSRAVELLAKRVLDDPQSADAYLQLGQALLAEGLIAEAVSALEAAAALDFSVAWFELASALEAKGDIAGAMGIWRKRLQILSGIDAHKAYASSTSIKLPQRMKLAREVGKHAAAADRHAAEQNVAAALAEYKAAVARWSMANRVPGER